MLLQLLYNTGSRVPEITRVTVGDLVLVERAACVHLQGKGRKHRSIPLWRCNVKAIRAWLKRNPHLDAGSPLLPNGNGHHEIPRRRVESNAEVSSVSSCQACPRGADAGVDNEHRVVTPGIGRWDD